MRRLLFSLLPVAFVWLATPTAHAANDPDYSLQWNMPLIGAETAWATGTGKGITIAVVDSGVDLNHEDLKSKLKAGRNFVTPGTAPQDDNGHGTHVAGIAAAQADNGKGVVGVARGASIMPVKVLDRDGLGAASIDEGIEWAVDHGAQVVNVSIGDLLEPLNGPPFVAAIDYAWTRGVICVISAGNEYVRSSDFEDEHAIVVTATTKDDTRPDYATTVENATWGMAAPGGASTTDVFPDDIYSTYWRSRKANQYGYLTGTSMAAPHVAGAAAVLRGLGLTPQQTVDRLLATAEDIGDPGPDEFGAGRLDVAKAVSGVKATGGPAAGAGTTTSSTAPGGSSSHKGSDAAGTGPSAEVNRSKAAPGSPSESGGNGAVTVSDGTGGDSTPHGSAAAAVRAGAEEEPIPIGPLLIAVGLEATVVYGVIRARRWSTRRSMTP